MYIPLQNRSQSGRLAGVYKLVSATSSVESADPHQLIQLLFESLQETLLKAMGVALPVQTKVLIFASNFVVNYWPFVFGIPTVVIIVLIAVVRRSQKAQYLWDYTKEVFSTQQIGKVLLVIVVSSVFYRLVQFSLFIQRKVNKKSKT